MRYSKETRELAIELRKQGKTLPEICTALSVPKGTVYYWIRAEEKPVIDRHEVAIKSWDARRESLNIGQRERTPAHPNMPKVENTDLMPETHWKGVLAMAKVQQRAAEKGLITSIPTSEVRYDLVFDDGNTFTRVQVKYVDRQTSKSSNGITVGLRKVGHRIPSRITYSSKDIDLVLVYVARLDMIIAIPPEEFDGKQSLAFRIRPAKSNQQKGTRNIYDYLW